MLQIIKVIDSKPSPVPGQIWERENSYYLVNSLHSNILWAYKFSNGEVTETAIDLKDSWRFKLFEGSPKLRDEVIDSMADALYDQDDLDNSDRIYELSRLNSVVAAN